MGVICRGWYRDTASAPGVHVTQLISELLKTVGCEAVVVVQHVIMGRSTCSLREKASSLSKQKKTITLLKNNIKNKPKVV